MSDLINKLNALISDGWSGDDAADQATLQEAISHFIVLTKERDSALRERSKWAREAAEATGKFKMSEELSSISEDAKSGKAILLWAKSEWNDDEMARFYVARWVVINNKKPDLGEFWDIHNNWELIPILWKPLHSPQQGLEEGE